MRPRILDLFCGAGGCSVGYHRAGFDVVGVDIKPQPRYPFEFIQGDALTVLADLIDGEALDRPAWDPLYWGDPGPLGWRLIDFEAIHASPPCQGYSTLRGLTTREYPRLIVPVRELLKATGLPYVIENVVGAPLRNAVMLCGSSFGLRVWRHRLFELSFPPPMMLPCSHHHHPRPLDVTGTGGPSTKPRSSPGGGLSRKPANLGQAREAMGIDWMRRTELAEAIPPAFTEYLGEFLMSELRARSVA